MDTKNDEMNVNDAKNKNESGRTENWCCTVCGYIYDGDPLPEHYVCPVCGAFAPKFERKKTEEK